MIVPILLLMMGILAAAVPARRASRVDPNVALRDL
jgi:ABC-type antimicrobial peptide transport system permease subunit